MGIIRLANDNFETYGLLTNPKRQYSSSSAGITGSFKLFPDHSERSMKELQGTFRYTSSSVSDVGIENTRALIVSAAALPSDSTLHTNGSFSGMCSQYLTLVNSQSSSPRFHKKQHVLRFTPGPRFDSNFMRKCAVRKSLFPYYKNVYPTSQWAYTNYNTLNFVTGGNLTTDSVLVYPASSGALASNTTTLFAPDKRFTFDFWINPRYTTPDVGGNFHAGTILHMSSCYAISLVTGSSYGLDGKSDGYRLILQLSHSADVSPSLVNTTLSNNKRAYPQDLAFMSDDNALTKNHWHHVAIRWDSTAHGGTGSFYIDGKTKGNFDISQTSAFRTAPVLSSDGYNAPDALFIGNYYAGTNYGANRIIRFFNSASHTAEGVVMLDTGSSNPTSYSFTHPLNAEINDLKIFEAYRTDTQIANSSKFGVTLKEPNLLFYVPPFFTKDSRKRRVIQTPFYDKGGLRTEDPFNVAMSFGIGGLLINLENYSKEFMTSQFPRLLNLTASRIDGTTTQQISANQYLYETGSIRKRNITILPCDNGKFTPNFSQVLKSVNQGIFNASSGTLSTGSVHGTYDDRFVDDFGKLDYSLVNISNMVETQGLSTTSSHYSSLATNLPDAYQNADDRLGWQDSLLAPMAGATPEDPGVEPGSILTILQRQRDPASNEVVFFDISNMFYGDRIKPKSFLLEDMAVTGSGGMLTFKVKDDGAGNLYRADSVTEHAKWSSVGNILYEEGIAVIKTPHMPHFGKDSFRVTFEGHRHVYVLEVTVIAHASQHNSSSNPTYAPYRPSNYVAEVADRFTYVTGIQLHDNNLNVIGRANLTQPIVKRDSDKIVFKLRMDF
jgi:hypothetical protein